MTLKFKNEDIRKHKSDFKEGNLKRVYTSFKLSKDTEYKGLCLCEYPGGEKYFVIKFYLRGNRKKKKYNHFPDIVEVF